MYIYIYIRVHHTPHVTGIFMAIWQKCSIPRKNTLCKIFPSKEQVYRVHNDLENMDNRAIFENFA
jgi:hypothetical protein